MRSGSTCSVAAIDARAGTKGILRAFSKWADIEAIDNYWADHVRDFFVKEGVQQKPGAAPAVVISHSYWQSHFGGNARAVSLLDILPVQEAGLP